MQRLVRICLATALSMGIAAGLLGCSATDSVMTDLSLEIRLSGSGTTLPLLHLVTDAYEGGVEFVYLPGLHSGGGIEGAYQGDLELGAVSRGLEGEEIEYGLDLTVISTDALAIAVHPSVEIDSLTSQQIRDVYAGVITDWDALGGPDEPIVVLDRPEDESAKKILREFVLGADFEVLPHAIPLYYEGDMVDAVESTPYSIGYFSMGYGVVTGADVRFAALDGVAPTIDTVADGSYAMTRELGVVHDPDPAPHVREFLEWVAGDDATELLAANGYAAADGQ